MFNNNNITPFFETLGGLFNHLQFYMKRAPKRNHKLI